jgi:hypothetical protein
MNYDQYVQEIVDVIKADKAIVQPWRNKAVARLEEAQAFIHEGKTTTYREAPGGLPTMQFAGPSTTAGQCVCTLGMPPRKDCPVHGGQS